MSRGQFRGVAACWVALVFQVERNEESMISATNPPPQIAGDQALTIAQADAQQAYQELSRYRIQLVLEIDGWHIDYVLKDPRAKGGGPHYVVDAHTGAIVSKRYDQ